VKVGIFVDSYKPLVTGVVHAVSLIRRELEDLGHEVHVFAPSARGYHDQEPRVHRFWAINLSTRVGAPLAFPYSRRLFGLIPRLGLDVIHTQHPFPVGRLGAYFARRLDLPLVYTFHTQYEQYAHYIPLNRRLVQAAARWLVVSHAERCDVITCPAPSAVEILSGYGVRRPIEMLANGIDLRPFEGARPGDLRARLGIGPAERVILYCGRLAKEKNLTFMLRALRDLLRRREGVRLILVGDGAETPTLVRETAQLGLDERVRFAGPVPYAHVPAVYAAADVFVMTSVTEVRPLALLEAMAVGLPVVAVAADGLTDTVTPGVDGLLTPHDATAFAAAVERLVDDEATRRAMGRRAQQTARRYSIATTTRRLVEIYGEARARRAATR
jgi:glycosyltransferase involved in cell wall biosynthesis